VHTATIAPVVFIHLFFMSVYAFPVTAD